MRLKSFYANTMTEAMQLIRDTLGDEAVIVSSRQEAGGGVRVTAALEQDTDIGFERDGGQNGDDWLQYDMETDDEDAVAEELTDVLLKHAATSDTIDLVVSSAINMGLTTPRVAMMAAFEHLFRFEPITKGKMEKPLMMVGLAGAGKTLAVAKFATRAVVNDVSVRVMSADTKRAGGVPQLEAFTKVLGVQIDKIRSSDELKAAIQKAKADGVEQILIDMPGVNAFDVEDMRFVAKYMKAADAQGLLVMQSGLEADEMGEIARAFSLMGVARMMPTRLDVARRLGGLLAAAERGGMAFAQGSHTEAVAEGLKPLSAEMLTDYFMPNAKLNESRHTSRKEAANH